MRGAYETPTEECPYCGAECHAEFCDVGVGMQQIAPYACHECHAYQAGPYDKPQEHKGYDQSTGWYQPQDYEPTDVQQGLIPVPSDYAEN
jgi:hypothetical protein